MAIEPERGTSHRPEIGTAKVERRIEEMRRTDGRTLNLSNLNLDSLPESVGRLTQIEHLLLSHNQLTELPESIGQLTQLRSLSLANNRLVGLPESIGQLVKLQGLIISNNRLTSLPTSMGRLARLQRLYIDSNKLTFLPVQLSGLHELMGLHVSQNPLGTFPSWVDGLRGLKYFSAASCQLTEVPSGFFRLRNLELLSLSGNPLTGLPDAIRGLASLRGLSLSMDAIVLSWDPDLTSFTSLAGVEGTLEFLPEGMKDLRSLRELYLHGQPHLGLPPEVLGRSWLQAVANQVRPANAPAILDYYFRTHGKEAPGRPLNEAKMILVGRGGVGKTSLVNRLVHDRYDPKETKTEGIFITPWRVQVRNDQIKLNIWDFGGQEIMHSTHQFFLTKRSLYVLVLNAREGEQDPNVEYWLRLIESFGGDSPVIVVINKIADHALDLNRRGLREKFPSIREFIRTDCESALGLDELRAAILRETDRLEHLRDLFPASWFAVKEKLANLRQLEGHDFISFSRYQALCAEYGVKGSVAQETLVGFLHDLGIVVNFRDDPRLAELHVLNPEWVTNGIYKILNAKTLATKQGELHLGDLPGVLDGTLYPRKMHLFLLDLMRKFELCYEYYDNAGHYLVPELLGKEEPNLTSVATADALRFEYRYNILPEGLLPRFIVRSRVLNKNQSRWRSGVVLQWERNTAVIKADIQDRRVSIAVVGPVAGRRRLLAVIRADFERIHGSITRLQASEEVPVPGYPGLTVDYETLLVMESEGESEMKLVHNGKVIKVAISDLLVGVDEVRRSREPMRTSAVLKAVRVAFSYSHKDEELRDQLETHLKLLQREGFVSSWYDRRIMPGERWRDVIDDNFNQADLILLLVSSDFIASEYCYEIEMKTALERESRHEALVVPVILRACDWEKAPFGKLQGLPVNGKPVKSWENRDEAWNEVAKGIRKTVEGLRQRPS